MGVSTSKLAENIISVSYGPKFEEMCPMGEQQMEVNDNEFNTAWPYTEGRLKEPDWKDIVKRGEPWTDPEFKPDSNALFINGKGHHQQLKKKQDWEKYEWVRSADLFPNEEYALFNVIEPEDVKQGNIDNCELLATISGLAERDSTAGKKAGKALRDLFLTKKLNDAGCYALKVNINGEDRVVVVDDWFPVKRSKKGEIKSAFAKSRQGDNEIWPLIIEKVWAKICGSYEASEGYSVSDAFRFLAGGPSTEFQIADFRTDIKRGPGVSVERFDKFWQMVDEANKKGWVCCFSTGPMPKEADLNDEESNRWVTVDGKGIKYSHTYTVLDARIMKL